jgi:hypothetical protein
MRLVEVASYADDKIAMSFASLVKNNNGFFKSEKQARFLLSRCDEDKIFVTGGHMYGNQYNIFYHCDDKGVTEVKKSAGAKVPKTTWKRKSKGESAESLNDPDIQARLKDIDNGIKLHQDGINEVQDLIDEYELMADKGDHDRFPENIKRMLKDQYEENTQKKEWHEQEIAKHETWKQRIMNQINHDFKTF